MKRQAGWTRRREQSEIGDKSDNQNGKETKEKDGGKGSGEEGEEEREWGSEYGRE